ncbi:hypothetical protein A5762_15290 [Mycolicibacterium elephantis]|nr:hypothetical protein A5762_15290 [Mycolicibacterium elephantis]
MTQKWKVRRSRRRDGTLFEHAVSWDVFSPDGEWSGTLETWEQAMRWATSFADRVEYWLMHNTTSDQREIL